MTSSAVYGTSIGGAHSSTIASETTRLGTLPVVRQFFSGMPGAIPSGLTTSMMWIPSFKCSATNYTGMAAGTFDAALTTTFRSWPAGQPILACYYHEPENDGFTLAQWKAASGHFNNLVHTMTGVTAVVKTIQIYMYGTILGWNNRHLADYYDSTWDANHQPDHFGFDFDGPIVNVSGSSYPDVSAAVSAAQSFAASKGKPWSVTEYGGDPLTSDSSHAGRATWNTRNAGLFSAGGAQYVTYWDDGTAWLSQTNEITAWAALVGQTPSTTPAAPTGVTVTPASDGLSAVVGWATLPGGVDHLDAYIQGPGQTYPHKLNTAPIPISPRTFSFPTVPGTTYTPGVGLVASADSAGTIRSGYSSFAVVVAPNPGSTGNSPIITTAVPAQDSTNPQLFHLTATATSPVGRSLSYGWVFTYPADSTVAAVTLAAASGDVTLPAAGTWNYTLTVTDTSGLSTPKTGSVVSVSPSSPVNTSFLNLQMLQHGETVLDMANIEQQSKPLIDAAMQQLYFRKSSTNAKYGLAASAFPPESMDPTTTLQVAAGNIYWGAFILEDIQLTQLLFESLTTAQSGTGVLVAVHDSTGAMVPEFGGVGVSADTALQGTPGTPLVCSLGLQVARDNWGDLLFWQVSIPSSGVTAAALRVSNGPTSNTLLGLAGSTVPLFGTAVFTSLQNPLPFGSLVQSKQIWVGAR